MRMEIGLVYKKSGRFYIAVTRHTALTASDGRFMLLRPSIKLDAARRVSVADLCRSWSCTMDELDAVTHRYLSPAAVEARERGQEERKTALKKAG